MVIKSDTGSTAYMLNESVDITSINKLYEDLKSLLANSNKVVMDAGKLKRIDTSAMQLLCCWFLEARTRDIVIAWKNTQGTFINAARLLGLADVMELKT